MGRRITAEEFKEWQLYFLVERLDPAQRHAEILAGLHNGAMVRRDKKTWTAAAFYLKDRWQKALEAITKKPAKKQQPTPEQLKAQIADMNARRKR